MKLVARRTVLPGPILLVLLACIASTQAQQAPPFREFRPGWIQRLEDLPVSRLRTRLQNLPPAARERALTRLRNFHFTEADLPSLYVDAEGGVFYADEFTHEPAEPAAPEPTEPAAAAVPVSPFPAGLVLHSRPGSANVLYLNFSGETVTGTAWNTSVGRPSIPAVAFSMDSDYSTFNDAEQTAIRRIWQRVAEDYAPFNIDVTTERPTSFNTRTAHALITRHTDANGAANPQSTSGGIAYVGVFGSSGYATHRPAWIYHDNLGNGESAIAEAASHEIGHNLGLSHDGTSTAGYYGGHGNGDISWGPIMGTGYGRNVSQWSRGEYYQANNSQDDLAVIASYISYRADDHGDTLAAATALVQTDSTNIVATTPENDPTNATRANKGILERTTDVDLFSFRTGTGLINLFVRPWIASTGTRGGNVDVVAELFDSSGALIMTNNPATVTTAQIQTTLAAGTYYLRVRNSGAGEPFNAIPTGYTAYGGVGQYFISGSVAPVGTPVQLNVSANNPAWGSVTPSNGTYTAGTTVQVLALPASYYRFVGWSNGMSGTSNPLHLVLTNHRTFQGVFAELLTANHPTPHWWLASHGYVNNLENVVGAIGANGLPIWQSYIAGLNPNDPASQLRLQISRSANGSPVVAWNTVTGRVYTLWYSTEPRGAFNPVPGASNLPPSIQRFTNSASPSPCYYRVEVRKP